MSTTKPVAKQFLEKSKKFLDESSEGVQEFLEIVKSQNMREIKAQLATDLEPLQLRLAHIEEQQAIIIDLLKKKLDLDSYEKEIMDLLKKKLEST